MPVESPIIAFLRGAFTANLSLKILSFGFAIALFTYIHGQQDVQERTIPVGVISLPPESEERELMTKIPPNIHVTLRGTTRAIDQLIQTGVTPVEIDLREGFKRSVQFKRETFKLPDGVEIVFVDPPNIDLEWQEVVTRAIPLQTSITGQPAQGYVVKGEPTVEPRKITVKGPISLVEVLQFARLSPFDVTGLTEGVWPRRIAIDAPPNRVSYLGPQSATVTVTIARRKSEKLFTSRRVEVVGPPHATVVPRSVDVNVIGPPEVVRALREEQVVPRADLTNVANIDFEQRPHGSASVPITVELGNAEAEVQPPSVTVKW
jgi:YbbR domain-containing protein